MIQRLRKKFIWVSGLSVFTVLLMIGIGINIANHNRIDQKPNQILNILLVHNGEFPETIGIDKRENIEGPFAFSPETPFMTRYFYLKTNLQGDIIEVNTAHITAVTGEEAKTYLTKVGEKKEGLIGQYKFKMAENSAEKIYIFIDYSRELEMLTSFFVNTLMVSVIGLVGVIILLFLFSGRAIQPIVQGYEKQKQFITDASHELKTPLAIIATNTEVVELENGVNQWTQNIQHQVQRLSELINHMVSLARMDEEKAQIDMIDFSISDAIEETTESFLALAEQQNKQIQLQIQKNISYSGNEQLIRELIAILLDNALKYSMKKSAIVLRLEQKGKRIVFEMTNKSENLPKGNLNILFERFYRPDHARNSQIGGHGIGLALAKAIVSQHHGSIDAFNDENNEMHIQVVL